MSDFIVGRQHFDNLRDAVAAAKGPGDVHQLLSDGSTRCVFNITGHRNWYWEMWASRTKAEKARPSQKQIQKVKKYFEGWTGADHEVAARVFEDIHSGEEKRLEDLATKAEAQGARLAYVQPYKIAIIETPGQTSREVLDEIYAAKQIYWTSLDASKIHHHAARFRKIPQFKA